MKGFTLIETLTVVAVFLILIVLSVSAFRVFEREQVLVENSAEEIINNLRLAKAKTLASESSSPWGVYFSIAAVPNQYTLFKGASFASRDISFDEVRRLSEKIEIFNISLAGPGQEVVFDRLKGTTGEFGSISLRLRADNSKIKVVGIEPSGQITLGQDAAAGEAGLLKDSRHVHFDYSRNISLAAENLILTFDSGAAVKEIIIANSLQGGQIYWQGEVNVGGEVQKLEILTHRLNNPDTQFSIKRDRRYNTKSLKIEISGDATGDLIQYDPDGQTTAGTSIYATTPILQ